MSTADSPDFANIPRRVWGGARVMSIRANFAGTCAGCGDRYPEGTPIQMVENYGWCHDQCPDPTNTTGPDEVSCTACWLIHPEGECDR